MVKSAIRVLTDIIKPEFIQSQISIASTLMTKNDNNPPYGKITLQYLTNLKSLLRLYLKLKVLDLTDYSTLDHDMVSDILEKCEDSFDSFI